YGGHYAGQRHALYADVPFSQRVCVKCAEIDLAQQACRCEVGGADAHRVAVGSVGQVERDDRSDAMRLRLGLADDTHAPNHVRVDPGSAHVFSDPVDHQHVEVVEGHARHQPPCLVEQLSLPLVADV